jgi:hypothetical protein
MAEMHASLRIITLAGLAAVLGACGGGGAGGDEVPVAAPLPTPVAAAPAPPAADPTPDPGSGPGPAAANPDEAARRAAAGATAASDRNDCFAIRPFYWELGDREAARAGGSVSRGAGTRQITADTPLALASSTKWLYAAYVAQRRAGQLEPWDVRLLTARGGYVSFAGCRAEQSVDACLAWQDNGLFTPEAEGRFYYGGGHFQKHASLFGLGALGPAALAAEWRSVLGDDLDFGLSQARPGGGATGSAATYARFLRKLLSGELALGGLLGTSAACAQPAGCPGGEALYSPGPAGQTWHYSLGHWVEDDPVLGDGSFSSAGAFGFYPWIDRGRTLYGVVAREAANGASEDSAGAGEASARCGRLIRQAWQTGVAR